MLQLLSPKRRLRRPEDITAAFLHENGIRGILLDVDNTLLPWEEKELAQATRQWAQEILAQGIAIVLVSNNRPQKVAHVAQQLGVRGIPHAKKPFAGGLKKGLALLGLKACETAIVGDQLFTDVLGGNRMGLLTIWVRARSRNEFIGTRLVRKVEKLVVRRLEKNKSMPEEGWL